MGSEHIGSESVDMIVQIFMASSKIIGCHGDYIRRKRGETIKLYVRKTSEES